jgi:hypothetical protein
VSASSRELHRRVIESQYVNRGRNRIATDLLLDQCDQHSSASPFDLEPGAAMINKYPWDKSGIDDFDRSDDSTAFAVLDATFSDDEW